MSRYWQEYHRRNKRKRNATSRKWYKENTDEKKAYSSAYYQRNKAKLRDAYRSRAKQVSYQHREKKYGITREEFNALWLAQGRKCGMCRVYVTRYGKPNRANAACVDHNHKTGEIRGILCSTCNKGLGLIGDKKSNAVNAVKYLSRGASNG